MARPNAVTFKGTPMTLAGDEVKVGQTAPDFKIHFFEWGLKTITPADLKSFAAIHFVRGGIKLAVAGDVTEPALKRYLQQLFLALPASAVALAPRLTEAGKPGTRTLLRNEAAPVAVFGMAAPKNTPRRPRGSRSSPASRLH